MNRFSICIALAVAALAFALVGVARCLSTPDTVSAQQAAERACEIMTTLDYDVTYTAVNTHQEGMLTIDAQVSGNDMRQLLRSSTPLGLASAETIQKMASCIHAKALKAIPANSVIGASLDETYHRRVVYLVLNPIDLSVEQCKGVRRLNGNTLLLPHHKTTRMKPSCGSFGSMLRGAPLGHERL